MWCCWISPGHNPASTQRHDRRAPNCWISPDHNPASTQLRGRRAPNVGVLESLARLGDLRGAAGRRILRKIKLKSEIPVK